MRPEDYRRFKPELWLQDHNPNPVPFNDLAVLQSELELRRRREIYRQSSQRRAGSTVLAVFKTLFLSRNYLAYALLTILIEIIFMNVFYSVHLV